MLQAVRRPVVAVGNSIGGFMSASLAADYPGLCQGGQPSGTRAGISRDPAAVEPAVCSQHTPPARLILAAGRAVSAPKSSAGCKAEPCCNLPCVLPAGLILLNSAGLLVKDYVLPTQPPTASPPPRFVANAVSQVRHGVSPCCPSPCWEFQLDIGFTRVGWYSELAPAW